MVDYTRKSSTLSTASNSSQRTSLRNSQQLKVKSKLTLLPYILVIIFLLIYIFTKPSQAEHNQVAEIHSSSVKEEQIAKHTSKLYIDKYCGEEDEKGCSQSEIMLLSSLIEILENDRIHTLGNKSQVVNSQRKQIIKRPLDMDYQLFVQYPLSAVKNPKLTTPKQAPSGFFSSFTNLFFDQYEGIQSLFQNSSDIWDTGSYVSYLTIASSEMMRPKMLQIISGTQQKCQMVLLGLTLTLDKQLLATKLDRFVVFSGVNWLECPRQECKSFYNMLLLRLEGCKFSRVKLFDQNFL